MTDIIPRPTLDFDLLVDTVAQTVASALSANAYAADLQDWRDWCEDTGVDPTFPAFGTVAQYTKSLASRQMSKRTIQRRLAAIRKLARIASILDYSNAARRAASESLKELRISAGHTDERTKRALAPAEVERALGAWDDSSALHARNRAMMGVFFCAGLRRSEVAVLRWDDIDMDEKIISVWHGKGDKARKAPIYGERTLPLLRAWRGILGYEREFCFPRMHKGDVIGEDAPITPDGVFYVVRETAQRAGEAFSPHDARRTFITERLLNGDLIADVQADVGHARKETTVQYAQTVEAKQRRARGRLRYG